MAPPGHIAHPDLPPRVLRVSRARTGVLLLLCLALLAGSVFLLPDHRPRRMFAGAAGLLLSGLAVPVLLRQTLRPLTLALDETGFALHGVRPFRETWSACGPFSVWHSRHGALVTFDSAALDARYPRLTEVNRRMGARGGSLPPGLGGMRPQELADLLNRYRDAYGDWARTAADIPSPRPAAD